VTPLRIGIDVGGTFTDVVAIDAGTRAIVARVKVPTTHGGEGGVADGIVAGLQRILACDGVDPAAIAFVAHSTTQATNALLEGDVARVGVVGLVGGFGAALARSQIRLQPIELAPGALLAPQTAFARAGDDAATTRAVDGLVAGGCAAIVASEPFGVDRPEREERVVACARERGAFATAGHEVASSYGLRARTRTAVLNAAILPTMVRTARLTAEATRRAGIAVPLMIMRSDGGVMEVAAVERRPIMTMLSGPAAGIAGALLHENVTDGIFIEVGGTSSDLSVVRRGLPQMHAATIGGHRTLLRTLDVRTLGIAGGSLARIDARGRGLGALRGVGPRSAHIAGLRYASFVDGAALAAARLEFVAPLGRDEADCPVLVCPGGEAATITLTCAANLCGSVPPGAFARGDREAARVAFDRVGAAIGVDGEQLAQALLERAVAHLRPTIEQLIADYRLERDFVELVGGGGGAGALVPFAARALGFPFRIARDAEVISPVGVALALVRDVVERTIPNPLPADVVRVRREAIERVVAAGAAPELVETTIELEPRRNIVRAIASGGTAAAAAPPGATANGDPQAAAARALRSGDDPPERVAATEGLAVYARRRKRALDACVVARDGTVRAVARRARVAAFPRAALAVHLARLLEDATGFGDVGRALPDCTLVYGHRVAELNGLADAAAVLALADEELSGLDDAAPVVAIVAER
jgi:N-methylhydantoinase A/oxoprolinase/acetone carboxylase beta subunit